MVGNIRVISAKRVNNMLGEILIRAIVEWECSQRVGMVAIIA